MSVKDITKSHTINEKILIVNVNNNEVVCKKKNCNKKCFKMHYDQIAECLLAFSLTYNIARTQMHAHRIRFDFPFRKDKTIILENKKFTSSGVLFFKDNLVYLFRNSTIVIHPPNRGNYYCGMTKGRVEEYENSLEQIAIREVYEESAKIFIINQSLLIKASENKNYIDNKDYNVNYRIYFLKLPEELNIMHSIYLANLDLIPIVPNNYEYHETDDIFVFNVNEINEAISDTDFYKLKANSFKDIEGRDRFIDRKTVQVIHQYFKQNKKPLQIKNYEIKEQDVMKTIHLF